MVDFNSPILIEAARQAAAEPVFHQPPILRRSSQRAWEEAEGRTIRVRLARLIRAVVKHWPTYETMSCVRWYVDRLEELWDQIHCSNEVMDDIKEYWRFLDSLLSEFESTYGKVDPLYFGRMITFLDEVEIGFSHVMSADRAFFVGPIHVWNRTGVDDMPEGPLKDLARFADYYL